eukprot:2417494-Amphidinium_carterae.1
MHNIPEAPVLSIAGNKVVLVSEAHKTAKSHKTKPTRGGAGMKVNPVHHCARPRQGGCRPRSPIWSQSWAASPKMLPSLSHQHR